MTLRTAGLIAGVLGVILLAVGLIAQAVKPAAEASPTAQVNAEVVVVPPEVLALSPDAVLTISADGPLAAHTARVVDADAWTASRTSVTLTGIADWDTLAATTQEPKPVASPSPTASPTASPSPAASPTASATASPSPTASATPNPEPTPLGSQDIWRATAQQDQTYIVGAADVPVGLTLVVEGLDGATVNTASLTMPRTIDDDWITQVIWWGAGLSVVGLVALIALFVDVRPAQSKGEEWLAQRSAIGSGKEEPKPGSRRARRHAGAEMPVAIIPEEAPATSGGVYVVPVTGSPAEVVAPEPASPGAAAFEPPTEPDHDDDEEGRS